MEYVVRAIFPPTWYVYLVPPGHISKVSADPDFGFVEFRENATHMSFSDAIIVWWYLNESATACLYDIYPLPFFIGAVLERPARIPDVWHSISRKDGRED